MKLSKYRCQVSALSLSVLFTVLSLLPAVAAGKEKELDDHKNRKRIEELFIWKVSDSLELQSSEEMHMGEIIRSIGQKKRELNQKMSELAEKMRNEKKSSELEKLVSQYQATQLQFLKLPSQETEQVRKLLGSTRTARYLVLKTDLTEKMKEALSKPEGTAFKTKEPKVIQE